MSEDRWKCPKCGRTYIDKPASGMCKCLEPNYNMIALKRRMKPKPGDWHEG